MTEKPDLEKIKQIAGDSDELVQQLLEIIKEELPQEIKRYKTHLENKDYLKSAEDVHKLKHKISILNLSSGYELAVIYENELRAGNPESAVIFENVLMAMTHFIEKF
ncbi:Hpt domain-containing protein [Leeuwenhoekiella sp. NPDC079379]|uniref:Hpt domain-containing protein n=1 Tax=Leeuwenhoekiella sp. NPDC079379 TaxID=3364122 RepID=UPI0037C56F78